MSLIYGFWVSVCITKVPILKEFTSEKCNSVELNTFTTYLSSLLGVIDEYNSNHAQKWGKYVEKVFNLTEFHFSEVTSFKIGTLDGTILYEHFLDFQFKAIGTGVISLILNIRNIIWVLRPLIRQICHFISVEVKKIRRKKRLQDYYCKTPNLISEWKFLKPLLRLAHSSFWGSLFGKVFKSKIPGIWSAYLFLPSPLFMGLVT